jgi:hypothetical protein
MPEITDPRITGLFGQQSQPAPVQPAPTIYRTPAKPLAPVSALDETGKVLSNTKSQIDIADAPVDRAKKEADTESAVRKNSYGAVGDASETELKNAGFFSAILNGNANYTQQVGANKAPGYSADYAREFAPDFSNVIGVNSPERQKMNQAKLSFIRGQLRIESGAAIGADEFKRSDEEFFPQPGDGPEVIEQKRLSRVNAVKGMRLASGILAGRVMEDFGPADEGFIPLTVDVPGTAETGVPGTKVVQNGVVTGFYNQDGQFEPIDSGSNFDAQGNPIPVEELNKKADSLIGDFGAGVGDIAQGVGDMAGIVANPVNMAINAATGSDLSTDLGQSLRNATGLPESRNPVASAINRGGAMALTGAGAAGWLARGGGMAGNVVVNSLGQQPIAQGVAGAASGAGASLTEKAGGGPLAQTGAALATGLTGFGTVNALSRLAKPKIVGPLGEAAKRIDVQLTPASAGGPATRRVSSASMQSPLSAGPVIKASQQEQKQIGDAAARISRNALPEDEAGLLVREGADLFIKSTSAKGARLYDRAGEAAKGVTITPKGALEAIDGHIAELSKLKGTNSTVIRDLQTLKADIKGGVDVAGLRGARTSLGGAVFDGKLRTSNEKRIYKDVLNALSKDIDGGLRQVGRDDAAGMFMAADKFWTRRVEQIDEVLQPILGKGKSGEDILSAVERMAQGKSGGVKRLASLMKELPPEQSQKIRETVISRLGKATAGRQDDLGETFSPATFLTNWNKMSAKGKAVLFGDAGLRRSLDDIAKVTNATKESAGYANTSNSSGGIWGNLGILVGAGFVSPAGAVAAGTTQLAVGRLMASPRFANWLAKVPANPVAQRQYIGKLPAIAAAEPVIANDIKSVMSFLDDALAASPTRAAAQDETDSGSKPPPE